MVRRSWVNFQCRGVLLVWIRVGQGPTALAVGAGGGCLDIFALIYPFSSSSSSLWETTRYRLKYCLKGSLSPKTTNQPKSNDTELFGVVDSAAWVISNTHFQCRGIQLIWPHVLAAGAAWSRVDFFYFRLSDIPSLGDDSI